MDAIYTATDLRDRSGEVKRAARDGLVRITENGKGAFVFCSERVFQQQIDEAVDRALYIERAMDAIQRGYASFERGDFVEEIDSARAAVAAMRESRG